MSPTLTQNIVKHTPYLANLQTFRGKWTAICCSDIWNTEQRANSERNVYQISNHNILTTSKNDMFKRIPRVTLENKFINRLLFTTAKSDRNTNESTTSQTTANEESNVPKPNDQKHENICTIPNLLCISRIVASPYLAHIIINNGDFSWALLIFMYAGLTDAVSLNNNT